MTRAETDLRGLVREIPDFPKEGVGFKDITPLLADPRALRAAVKGLAEYARPLNVDCVIAAEARGFLLGPALALELEAGFVLARKPGKLPYETVSASYLLEYGSGSSSCTPTRWARAGGSWCTTICSPRAAPRERCASSSRASAGRLSDAVF